MEDPWTGVISLKANSNKFTLSFTNIHDVSYDGIQEIKTTRIGASYDAEGMLKKRT